MSPVPNPQDKSPQIEDLDTKPKLSKLLRGVYFILGILALVYIFRYAWRLAQNFEHYPMSSPSGLLLIVVVILACFLALRFVVRAIRGC